MYQDCEYHSQLWEAVESEGESSVRDRFIILDVGGERFQARRAHFTRYPETRLGKLLTTVNIEEILSLCDEFLPGNPTEYFFDRNPGMTFSLTITSENFPSVVEMYRSGEFHIPDSSNSCVMVMKRDFAYWGLDELSLQPCCSLKFYPEMMNCSIQTELDIKEKIKEEEMLSAEVFEDSKLARFRSSMWDFLEKPWTSMGAKIFAVFSLSVLFISTITFVVSSLEDIKEIKEDQTESNSELSFVCHLIDIFSFSFFTLEYFCRLLCSPHKWKFFKQTMNLIDLLILLPFYISLILEGLEDYQIIGRVGKILRLMRILKIMRVYKLFRHFAGLRSIIYTLRQAYRELGLLFHVIGVSVMSFASIVYLCEAELRAGERTERSNWTYLDSFWWSLMTITTVGQEDNPRSNLGKLSGGLCALVGVFLLTLPLPIVVNSFAGFYKNRLWRNEVAAKKRDRARGSKRKGSSPGPQSCRDSHSQSVSRQKSQFQHRARQINKMRTKDEMTVADMHNLVYQ